MGKYIYQTTGLAAADIQTGDFFVVSRSGATPATSFGAKKITTKDLLAGSVTSRLISSGISGDTTAIRNLAAGIAADPTAAADVGAGVELIASGSSSQIQYNQGGTPNQFGGAELYYDSVNARLGVNKSSPSYTLHVDGVSRLPGITGDNITGNLITGNNIYANNLFVNNELVDPTTDNEYSAFRMSGFTLGGSADPVFNSIGTNSTFIEDPSKSPINGEKVYSNGQGWYLWFDGTEWILSYADADKSTRYIGNGSTSITTAFPDPAAATTIGGSWTNVSGTSSAVSSTNVWLQNSSDPNKIYYNAGVVGLGTSDPQDGYSLHVATNPALFSSDIIGSGSQISGILVTGNKLGSKSGVFQKALIQTGYITGLESESINLHTNSHSGLLIQGQNPGLTLSNDSYLNQSKINLLDIDASRGFNLSYSGAAHGAGIGSLTLNTVFGGNHLQEAFRVYRNGGQVGFGFAGGDASNFDSTIPRAPVDISGRGYANLLIQGANENKIVLGSDENNAPEKSEIVFASGNRSSALSSYTNNISLVSEVTGSLNGNLGPNSFEIRSNDNSSEGVTRYASTKLAVTSSGHIVMNPYSHDVEALFQINADRGAFIPKGSETGYPDAFYIKGTKQGNSAIRIDLPDRFDSFTSSVSGQYRIRNVLYGAATGYAERVILLHEIYTGEFQYSDTGKWVKTGAGSAPSDTGLNINLVGHTDWTGQKANFCIGEFSLMRGGAKGTPVFENVMVNTFSAFSSNQGFIEGNQYNTEEGIFIEEGYQSGNWELVTGLHNSKPWMALKLPYNTAPPQNLYFKGFHKSDGEDYLSGFDVNISQNTFDVPGYTPGEVLNSEFYYSYSPFNQRTEFLNNDSSQAFPILENILQKKVISASQVDFNCGINQENVLAVNKDGLAINLTGNSGQASLHLRGYAHNQFYLDTPLPEQDAGMRFYEGPASDANLKFHLFHDASLSGLQILANQPSTGIFITDSAGDVGIGNDAPSTQLEVNGTVTCTSLVETSDFRIKKNIKPISGALNNVLGLSGVSFDFKDKSELDSEVVENYSNKNKSIPDFKWFGKESELGLIAQNVESHYPSLVNDGHYGLKGINYAKLVPVLVEAIKEQNELISGLSQRISDLEG